MSNKAEKPISSKSHALPYGHGFIKPLITGSDRIDVILPGAAYKPVADAISVIDQVLSSPIGNQKPFSGVDGSTRVAIAINDKTRPVPNSLLLPPLLKRLHLLGVRNENITFFIATGTHEPMLRNEFHLILENRIVKDYPIISHDCDDSAHLYAIGTTSRGTPVQVNREFYDHDITIVVGDIEPHHFAGYSGGVKTAAIGLAGRVTINTNHKLLLDERSFIGIYEQNPLRQDIEEIGAMMNIDLALNAILNEKREIIGAFFGEPVAVMKAGMNLVDQVCRTHLTEPYDIVIASAGGHPKDINLYQSQKAMTHASLFCKPGGTIILVAECAEGVGSRGYLEFMSGVNDVNEVIEKFRKNEFEVGPHKAFQIARILQKHPVYLFSSLSQPMVKSLLLKPLEHINMINDLISEIPNATVAVLPYATACIASTGKELDD